MYPNFSEFGLYRYESAAKRSSKRNGYSSSIIIYSIIVMILIFGALFFVFINSRIIETSKIVHPKNSTIRAKSGLQIIEISSRNASETENLSIPKPRFKRLDTEENDSQSEMPNSAQKLIFYPSRTLKPLRIAQKTKAIQYTSLPPNHKISSRRVLAPQQTLNKRPHAFLQPPTTGSRRPYFGSMQNIHNAMRQNYEEHDRIYHNHNYAPTSVMQVRGTYRHPRKQGDLSQILHPNHRPSNAVANYISPYEINQMANPSTITPQLQTENNYMRRKFRQQVASIPNYNIHARDAANIYGNILQSSHPQRQQQQHQQPKVVTERNEISHGATPFSVMFDMYPMHGGEEESAFGPMTMTPRPLKVRPLPFMSRLYQDPQYFNTMNFPQVMHRYPPYFHFQHQQPQYMSSASNYVRNYHAMQQPASSSSNGIQKPSQIVVHLNLFPKNQNSATFKRNSMEVSDVKETRLSNKYSLKKNQTADGNFNINFNVNTANGHPENIMHQQYRNNQSSRETTGGIFQNYYDDDEDFIADESESVTPSMIYKNVLNDRPYYYEYLRNTTKQPEIGPRSSTKRPIFIKNKQNLNYKIIDRSKNNHEQHPTRGPFY